MTAGTLRAVQGTAPDPVREVRVHPDGALWLVRRACAEIDEEAARAALARQPALRAPAKLACAATGGVELCVELLNQTGLDVEQEAEGVLTRASAWLAGLEGDRDVPSCDGEILASALACLPTAWTSETRADGGHHVHATAFGDSVRLRVEASGGGARVFVESAVPTADPESVRALMRFALEANARLRLARVSVAAHGGAVRVTWDAVTSPGAALERAVPAVVEAVAGAHATTRRALRALGHAPVARAYLEGLDEPTRPRQVDARSQRATLPPA